MPVSTLMGSTQPVIQDAPPPIALLNNPKFRALAWQLVLLVLVLWLGWQFALNARANLEAQKITGGFGFLDNTAGFGVNQSLIAYNESDTYGRVFLVGLFNTLLVAGIGIVLATILGFLVGVARLSPNWLLARLAGGYVELIRNLPLLFQILFWYLAVLGTLPGPRQSISLFGEIFSAIAESSCRRWFGKGAGCGGRFRVRRDRHPCAALWTRRRQMRTGRDFSMLWVGLVLIVLLPVVELGHWLPDRRRDTAASRLQFCRRDSAASRIRGAPARAHDLHRRLHRRDRSRRYSCRPARPDRGGLALGLRRGLTLRLVILPQALRVIVPPLTNQYLNLTKNSSLAVAVGYPDLFAVFAGTVLNQTGQAIEIIAITMAVYFRISLLTSGLMNWYNARIGVAQG